MTQFRIITDASLIDRNDWEAFVLNHPSGNVFHSPGYFDLCNSSPNNSAVALFCLKDNLITGVLISIIQKEYSGIAGWLTSRGIIWGGPIVLNDDAEIAGLLISAYKRLIRNKVLFCQFRNLTDPANLSGVFKDIGFVFEDHLNILINLSTSKEKIWAGIHPTRRKQINRSIKRGVDVMPAEPSDSSVIEDCYKLLKKRYNKEGLPLPSKDFFISAANLLGSTNVMRIFVAMDNNRIIGFRMVLCYSRRIYDWYAASDENYYEKYPNDLLPWSVMSWGSENGFSTFDFGGAGVPGKPYGVRDYKMKFGGELVNYGRFTFVNRKIAYAFVMAVFRLRKLVMFSR